MGRLCQRGMDFRENTGGEEALWEPNSMFGGMPAYFIAWSFPEMLPNTADYSTYFGFTPTRSMD